MHVCPICTNTLAGFVGMYYGWVAVLTETFWRYVKTHYIGACLSGAERRRLR